MAPILIPAQVRAGRALLGLSQEALAELAKVGLSTVRDLEAQRRPVETTTAEAVRRALDNAGVVFVQGDATGGPGVRMAAHRPNIIRRPTVVTAWDGVPFEVEVQGKALTVFVSREALEDVDRLTGQVTDEQLLAAFENHSGRILDAVAQVQHDPTRYDRNGRLHVRTLDLNPIPDENGERQLLERIRPPEGAALVRLRPLPRRVWRGVEEEQRDDLWSVQRFEKEKGYVLLNNTVTGHYVPLYAAHVRGWLPDQDGGGPANGRWLMELTVQMVFEDGHPRLEYTST